MEWQVICVKLSEDGNSIEEVGVVLPGLINADKPRIFSVDKVLEEMEGEQGVFYVIKGVKTQILPYRDEFIRTKKNNTTFDNLRKLGTCKSFE